MILGGRGGCRRIRPGIRVRNKVYEGDVIYCMRYLHTMLKVMTFSKEIYEYTCCY